MALPSPVTVYKGAISSIQAAGQPTVAVFGGVLGGLVFNPSSASDQGIATAEVLYYNLAGDADSRASGTTFALQPGQTLFLPKGLSSNVSVNAATVGHRFSAVMWQTPIQPTPTPVPGTFPPAAPTSLATVIPSYLYVEYNDDDDLQAFVRSQNEMQQEYINLWNTIGLPVYTGALISGTLLDWVAQGLYGMMRPTLSSGRNADIGPYNTVLFNRYAPYNSIISTGSSNVAVTTDDIFKRIMTWNLYRGDGRTFCLQWLKRRIIRFLNGPNGIDPVIDNTYAVSCFYSTRTQINVVLPVDPNATLLKEAIDSRAVSLPFQINFSVTIA